MAKAPANLRSLARSHTEMCLRTLCGIAQSGENEGARVRACEILLDRGWGKAPVTIAGEDGDGALQVIIRHIVEGAGQRSAVTIEHQASAIEGET